MRSFQSFLIILIISLSPSCVPMKKFTSIKDELNNASKQNELLRQENLRLQTANTEMESANRQFSERNRNLTARLDEALYDLNAQKQKAASLERNIDQLNRQMESLKTGSTAEIENLLKELHTARLDLNQREDKLREAEKELEQRNARLIELQDVLAQKDQAVKDLRNKVVRALTGFTNEGLTVHEKNGKVYVSMDEKLLFKTGRWDVDPKGQQALRNLSQLLADNSDISIMVEGHTDDVPMRGAGDVKDNWDLSVMRATAVTKILTLNPKLSPERIIAAGRSEYLPLVSETTSEARQMNRRTEIILTPRLDELLKLIEMN
jgi:chemotaxis protein MotB